MSTENKQVAVAAKTKGEVIYSVAGQEVKLSYQIVRDYLTKGGGNVSDQDLTQFISICKYNELNPFLGEAYLVKFGTTPASMIVSKEAFFKRAEANAGYDGFEAGIIVKRGDEVLELEGSFKLPTDELLGGWAKVHRKDRKFPIVSKVSFSEYNKGQSTWKEKPSTMISKVAKVQALREAFPTQLGAMYIQEEADNTVDTTAEIVSSEIKAKANKSFIDFDTKVEQAPTTEPAQNGQLFNDEKPGF